MTLSDQLRRAIDASGFTRYRVCKVCDVNESQMSRFMARKGGLSLEAIDRVCGFLRIDLTPPRNVNRE